MMKQWAPVVALLAIAVGTGWFLNQLESAASSEESGPEHAPDFYMEDFTTTTMDEAGRLKRRLKADYMEHFPDTDASELENPYLVLYDSTEPPWHVRSERGWVSADGDVILLLGEVHIWHNSESGEREVDIETRDLRVLPQTEYGETDQPVVIRTPTTESRGVGMRTYLEQSRVELLSQVRTIYDKNRR